MSQKAIATVSASVTVSVKLWYFVHCLNLLIHHKTGIVFHFYLFSLVIKVGDTKKWAFRVVVMCNGMQLVFNTKGLFVSWWGMELMRWVKEKVKEVRTLPASQCSPFGCSFPRWCTRCHRLQSSWWTPPRFYAWGLVASPPHGGSARHQTFSDVLHTTTTKHQIWTIKNKMYDIINMKECRDTGFGLHGEPT